MQLAQTQQILPTQQVPGKLGGQLGLRRGKACLAGSAIPVSMPHRGQRSVQVRASAAGAASAAAGAVPSSAATRYGWLMASYAFIAIVYQGIVIQVSKARKAANVPYPRMTADGNDEASKKFNCTLRAQLNTLENLPIFLAVDLLLAQVYPLTAAALAFVWGAGRVVYAAGYGAGDPAKRIPGAAVSNLTQMGSILTLAVTAFNVITGRI